MYYDIAETNIMLNANAALIHSNLGYCKQGHLILTISVAQCNKVSTTQVHKANNSSNATNNPR